jgi:HK97 family phage portal protein
MLGRLLETRGAALQNLFASGALFERPSPTGVHVTQDTSLRLSAVYASVRLISDTISTMPLDQFERIDGARRPVRPRDAWVDRPSLRHQRATFWQQNLVSLLLDGNIFAHVMRDGSGEIVDIDILNPIKVEVLDNGFRVDGNRFLRRDEVLHITEMLLPGTLRGVSRIEQVKDSVGLGMALDEYAARFFGNGAYAGGVIEWPGEITQQQAKEMIDAWEGGHKGLRRAHRPAVLYGGAKFTTTSVDPSQSQLIDQRHFAVEEIARIFRVPPFMLGVMEQGSVSYASVEQQMLFFTQLTIQPYAELLEQAYSTLLDNPATFIKFNIDSLVRADLATRTEAYSKALLAGFMSVNDVRRLEDMPDVPDGEQFRVPLQNVPTTDAAVVTLGQKAKILQSLVIAGYTPQSAAQVVGLPELEHTGLASVQLQPEEKDDGNVEAG